MEGTEPRLTSHTPGPWDDTSNYPEFASVRIFAGSHYIATVGNSDDTKAQTEANAHLIAAAPDLKDGCNALIGLIQLACLRDDMPPKIKKVLLCSHRMDEALTALAKAEGR